MKKNDAVRPLGQRVLIRKVREERKAGALVLPDGLDKFQIATVLALPRSAGDNTLTGERQFRVGDRVAYVAGAEEAVAVGDERFIVPAGAIVAVLDASGTDEEDIRSKAFFKLPPWKDFKDERYEKVWKQWENIREFRFNIGFLEPFESLDPLREAMYEACVRALLPQLKDNLQPLEFKRSASGSLATDDKEPVTLLECKDDYFDGQLFLAANARLFGFRKKLTTLKCLVETLPVWMEAIHRIICSPAFISMARPDYSRLCFVDVGIEQIIRLEGKGGFEDPIKNSECMGHFLRFGLGDNTPISPTLAKLGIEAPLTDSIGRVDVKLSYERKIGPQEYTVWLTVQAPTNEQCSTVHIDWEVQNLRPTNIADRKYGDILSSFFRNTVLLEFYKTWFKDIRCTSL